MNLNKLLTEIEERVSKAIVPYDYTLNAIDYIPLLLEICKRQREALDAVIERYESYGGDARKLGVPLGLYTVCRNAIADCDALAEKGGE